MTLLARIARRLKRLLTPTPPHACSAATVDLGAASFARDPFSHYEELRRSGVVQYLAHHDSWIVLGYDEVQYAFAHPELFSNRPYAGIDAVLLGADPPDHTAVRRIVSRYFAAPAMDALCAFAEGKAAELLVPELDVVGGYAKPLSESVAAHFLGVESDAMFHRLRDDGFAEEEARSLVHLLWLASTETTERLIARCVLRLLQHDDVRRRVTEDRGRIPAFVEEVLRLHPPENILFRTATEDVPLGGATIPAEASVYLALSAANRDPAKFAAPHELRLGRAERPLTFGFGIHHCVGATLGRRTIAVAVRTLLERAPHFRAAEPLDALPYHSSLNADSLKRLILDIRP
jgi:cytochrome P450